MGNRVTAPAVLRAIQLPGSSLRFIVDNLPGTVIQPSRIHGNGLFAARDFATDTVLGTLDGQIVDWASFEAAERGNAYGEHASDLFMEWNALSDDTLLIRPFRTKYGFINHSRTPNIRLVHDPLRVVAVRDTAAGEELTLDYRCEPLRADYLKQASYL